MNQSKNYLRRDKRVELVFQIFPEINKIYKEVMSIIKEAKKLDETNAILLTNDALANALQSLMNFQYLDDKLKDIDIEQYDKNKVIEAFYKAGCDAYTFMAYYYYQKKTDILEKYKIDNIEDKISNFYDLYETAYKSDKTYILTCTKEQLHTRKLMSDDVYEEFKSIEKKESALKEAFEDTEKQNNEIEEEAITTKNQKSILYYITIITSVFAVIAVVWAIVWAIYTHNGGKDSAPINVSTNESNLTDQIIFSSNSSVYNTKIDVIDLKSNDSYIDTKLSAKPSHMKYFLKKSSIILLGNIHADITIEGKPFKYYSSTNGIFLLYKNSNLEQITYKQYKQYLK